MSPHFLNEVLAMLKAQGRYERWLEKHGDSGTVQRLDAFEG